MCVLNFIMMLRRLVTVKTCDIWERARGRQIGVIEPSGDRRLVVIYPTPEGQEWCPVRRCSQGDKELLLRYAYQTEGRKWSGGGCTLQSESELLYNWRSVIQSVNQSVSQSVGQSVSHSVSQSASQSVSQSVRLGVETLRDSWPDLVVVKTVAFLLVVERSLWQEDGSVM
jgi:hypothetical protein